MSAAPGGDRCYYYYIVKIKKNHVLWGVDDARLGVPWRKIMLCLISVRSIVFGHLLRFAMCRPAMASTYIGHRGGGISASGSDTHSV